MILKALNNDHDDHDQDSNHIAIKIPLQENSVSVSDTLAHPIAVMTEPFTTKVAYRAVVDCVVNQRSTDGTLTLTFAFVLLRTDPVPRLVFGLPIS